MELYQLFIVQQIMEDQIKELSNFKEDYLGKENISDLRFLALHVKVAELANLTKCYKYAKIKDDLSKDKILILYIDTMKYLLSIGNMYQFSIINKDSITSAMEEKNIVKLFSDIFENIVSLKSSVYNRDELGSLLIYIKLFANFINLGTKLNLSFEEVHNFYITKYLPKEVKI